MKEVIKQLNELKNIQGTNGTWNYDPYCQGMYNGIELCLAILEDRDPNFKDAPPKWINDK